jgi:tRNA(Leu) C34 or U34 (ribose-2'-O)-methylase TrmL
MSSSKIFLENPKYPHNVGGTVRAASCYGFDMVLWSGDRVPFDASEGYRLPREERMRGYRDVRQGQMPGKQRPALENFGIPIICVELVHGAIPLPYFQHPDEAVYVFGPEDGTVSKGTRSACHQFVFIPTRHCMNLAAAVYSVLYDRELKLIQQGKKPVMSVEETLASEDGFSPAFYAVRENNVAV